MKPTEPKQRGLKVLKGFKDELKLNILVIKMVAIMKILKVKWW